MAEADDREAGLGGELKTALGLIAATVLWGGAIWVALNRPDLTDPYGPEARFAALAVAWGIPLLLTILSWATLRRAREALAAARALHAETDALARHMAEARRTSGSQSAAAPAAWPEAEPKPAAPAPAPQTETPTPDPTADIIQRVPRAPLAAGEPTPTRTTPPDALWAALDFPRSESDEAAFAALRRAMADEPSLADVIRTAQHVLSLLAQEGVHLQSTDRSPPPPEVWRHYVDGTRGPALAPLGEPEDRESLALTVGRLRRDPAFRSAAHRFVAAFDTWLAGFARNADDVTLQRVGSSRTARAFRLLGRATGSFG
ncbi:hypothetical protein [Pararhodobacter sp. SW119]|uniref:hypothetical protein n=1 Tax=Pararhodobacter sp. SW119 TaxID=2780075 RepID=UPI001ADF0F94|nr:hypothetical protein [Pararhodobacter sp. SW119]